MRKENPIGLGAQVLAGALAAITAAFVGSRLGIAGTVLGAGIASVLTTVGVALYQRMHARSARWAPLVASGAVAFVLGMVLITGLEWARGEPLSGGRGTTIGGIVRPPGGSKPAEVTPNEPTQTPTVTTPSSPPSTTVETTPSPPPTSGDTTTTPPPTTTTTTAPPTSSGAG